MRDLKITRGKVTPVDMGGTLSWESSPSSWLQSMVHNVYLAVANRDSYYSGAAAESSTFRAIWNQIGILFPACQADKKDSSTQAYPRALRMGLAPWRHLRKINTPSFLLRLSSVVPSSRKPSLTFQVVTSTFPMFFPSHH